MIFDWKTEIHRHNRYFVNIGKMTERKDLRSMTGLTVTFFVISFFVLFAIKPTFIIVTGLTREIKDKREIDDKLQKKITTLVAAQEEYSLNENRFYLLDQALPETSEFPSFIVNTEKEAASCNVQIQSFAINKIVLISAKESSFGFDLTATGNYQDLKTFLGRFEQLRRIFSLESISFGRTKKTVNEPSKIRLNISGKVNFYQK